MNHTDRASLGKGAYVLIRPSLDQEDERFSLHQHFFTLGADLWRTVSCSWESCVCTGSAGVGGFEAGTLLTTTITTTTRVGFTEEFPSPCATPPRLALSGALVVNTGYERSRLPAALWTACTQPCYLERRDGSPRMQKPEVQRNLQEGPYRG
ncbi:hypothetical protein INR49_030110 [Caranx melampygus]|nr:hypothetical protein INR49_030110 [Caranx melampygus]